MKLTSKGRYAVTAMLDIAIHEGSGPITLAEISERQDISLSYLEQLFAKLRRKGLVNSSRGPGGGYRLASEPQDITVRQIIVAVDENIDTRKCGGKNNCQNGEGCLSHCLWQDLSNMIEEFLDEINLASLVKRKEAREVMERQDIRFAAGLTI